MADADHDWRHAFYDMLWSTGEPGEAFSHPGWSVYRNTTQRGCLSALAANYPALHVLTGAEAFGVLARAYLKGHRPTDARLLHFGADLPDFLAQFEPASQWPHLVDIAWLDRLWVESHVAADADALTASHVLEAGLDPQQVCLPHPATRWLWCADHPVATLWLDARVGQTQRDRLHWRGEGLLLTRPDGAVRSSRLSQAGACFLDACHRAEPLAQALAMALQAEAQCDLSALVAQMLAEGALLTPESQPPRSLK